MDNYRFETWNYGYKTGEVETSDIDEIRKIIKSHLNNTNVGIKLFINDVQVPYLDIKKVLGINTFNNTL